MLQLFTHIHFCFMMKCVVIQAPVGTELHFESINFNHLWLINGTGRAKHQQQTNGFIRV